MPNKLPADFDPDWYAASYPDVALSGLSPREHYLRFGSLLGRAARGTGQPKPEPTKPAPKLVKTPPRPAAVPVPPKVQPPSPPPMPKPATPSPIIERPAGFDPLAAVPKPAAPREGSVFSLDTVANLPGPDPRNAAVSDAIYAYARLLRVDEPGGVSKAEASLSCGASTFQTGPSRLDNAWLVCPRRLRLMLAGHEERAEEINGLAVRAYQADPASPGEFRLLGQGVQLPPHGPVLHDVELQHPLMPLVLELSDAGGVTRGLSLLPFPSLLPGGLHGAELKALQTEPNPIDDFWAFSEALLREAVGRDGSPARSVARVSVAGEGTALDQAALTSEVQEWLTTVIGLGLEATNDPADQGLQLLLPPDCVPTISALVTRGLEVSGTGALIGPYLVAEAGTYRPRWSIVLPADVEPGTAIPLLRRGNSAADAAPSRETAPFPLAIAIRATSASKSPSSADDVQAVSTPALGIVVHASDRSRAEQLIQSIRSVVAGDVEWLIRGADTDREMSLALERACGADRWVQLPHGADLRRIARDARHETLLTISDRVQVGDGRALRAVLDLLQREEKAASASCALLAEKVIKKEVVIQPASGGLFPTGVSFVSGPRLTFGEPNALEALPDLAYPVIANTLDFTVWRRSALAELPPMAATGQSNVEDVRIGLDLMRAGFRNWCTTQVAVRLSGPYVPRDQIDPMGPGYMQPDGWENILGRVTVLRELF